jgi:hypothetical protein
MSTIYHGKSGCSLEILGANIIRKISKNKEYNLRLRMQAEKQKNFKSNRYTDILAPKVFNIVEEQLLYFEMEYLPSSTYFDFFKVADIDSIKRVSDILINYFNVNLSNSENKEVGKLVNDKLSSLLSNSSHKEIILELIKLMDNKKIEIPISYCHGDLTLNNMLFLDSNIYLIDFLDSFVESPIIDLVKLKQDLQFFWSQKLLGFRNTRSNCAYYYIWDKLNVEFKELINSIEFKVFEAINFLRIEPYVSNEFERNLLDQIIERLEVHAELNNANGR